MGDHWQDSIAVELASGETVYRANGDYGQFTIPTTPGVAMVGFSIAPDGSLIVQQAGRDREAFAPDTWRHVRWQTELQE